MFVRLLRVVFSPEGVITNRSNRLTFMLASRLYRKADPLCTMPFCCLSNEGFLQNTLKTLFRLSRGIILALEMHSKRRYRTDLYLSSHLTDLRGTWVFSKLKGLQYRFLENFRYNLTYYESENFSDSSLHQILNPKSFFFLRKTALLRNFLEKLRKLYIKEWNGYLEIFSRSQLIENSGQYLLLLQTTKDAVFRTFGNLLVPSQRTVNLDWIMGDGQNLTWKWSTLI